MIMINDIWNSTPMLGLIFAWQLKFMFELDIETQNAVVEKIFSFFLNISIFSQYRLWLCEPGLCWYKRYHWWVHWDRKQNSSEYNWEHNHYRETCHVIIG